MFTATLFTIAKKRKQPKSSSNDKWVNKMWTIHTKLYCLAIKRSEVLIHVTKCMNFFFFWLRWVFVAVRRLSPVAAGGDYSSLRCVGFSLLWLLFVAEHRL